MIAKAEKTGRILMVGHICRFNLRYALAKDRIARGEIGRIVSMYARRNIPAERSRTVLEKVGPLLGDGIHDTDLMLWMSKARIETVHAMTHNVRGLKNPDIAWAMYRFDGGAIGVIENVWMLPPGTPFRIHEQMEIIGEKGAIYIHGGDTNLVVQGPQGIDCPDTLYWPQLHGVTAGALRSEISYFVDCVVRGVQPTVVTPVDARNAVQATLAAEKSARTGKTVRLAS
jgi:predicted dehydrogenase